MTGIFKAYDVRGLYPDQLDERIAYRIGRAFAQLLEDSENLTSKSVVVSFDMRPHGQPLRKGLVRGLIDGGFDIIEIGLATTPMNYFAVGHLGAAGGVQITASHNPARYNGFKFSLSDARPVSGDDGIPRIERLATIGEAAPPVAQRGSVRQLDIAGDYGRHVLSFLDPETRGARRRVVVDAANGMGTIYREWLEQCGIEMIPLFFELDGNFPNHEANPLKIENLADLRVRVRKERADFGVAFDGDADRAIFVDDHGEPLGSDLVTALIGGRKLEQQGGGVVVYDVRSSRAVPKYLLARGGEPVRERVGHSFIKATLRERSGIFGGELAGHYYFKENYYADCALLAVVEMLNLVREKGQSLSAIAAPLRTYAKSEEINFEVEDKDGAMAELERRYAGGQLDKIDGIRIDFPDWWFNVRASNTEPLLRLVLEADNQELLEQHTRELVDFLGTPV